MKIQLKKSIALVNIAAKEPSAEQMEYGELAVNYNVNDPAVFLKASDNNIIRIAGANGALTIQTAGEGASATGSFTANQSQASTLTLPTIRYGDLSGTPSIPAAANNGKITIVQPGTTNQTFTVNQSGNTTITLKNDNTQVTPGNGALTIQTAGEGALAIGSFTANQISSSTLTLPVIRYTDLSNKPTIPAAANNGKITIVQPGTTNQTFTVNQSGDTTITLKNDNTQVTPGNGAIQINGGTGITASGNNARANQSATTTRTLSLNTTYTDGRYVKKSGDTITGTLNAQTIAMSGQILMKVGTHTSPSIGIQGDGNTGILGYNNNAGTLAFVSNGNNRFKISPSEVEVNPDHATVTTNIFAASSTPVISVSGSENVLYVGKTTANNSGQGYTERAQLDVFATSSQQVACRLETRSTSDVISINGNKSTSSPASQYIMSIRVGSASSTRGAIFWQASTGSILYQNTSDYRTKENIVDYTGGIQALKQLKPVSYNFIGNANSTQVGFIAHELQEVIPAAVSGVKDEVDADGEPVLQGVDASHVVATLTAALQEAVSRIEALEAKVTSLEVGSN